MNLFRFVLRGHCQPRQSRGVAISRKEIASVASLPRNDSRVVTALTFWLLVVLAFSLRAVYFNQTVQFIQPGSGSDSYFYLQWAKDIVRGNVVGKEVFYALPAYPYFLSLAYLFSGGEIYGIILIQILIGAINCGLLYLLGRRLFNEPVGIIASIIASGYSMLIFYDRMLLPTTLAISLGLLLILLLMRIREKPTWKGWLGAGLLLGLSTLARASFFLLFFFILFWLVCEYKKRPLRQLLLYCTSFILAFFLIIGGITLRNYVVAKDPVLLTAHSGINFYIGNNPRANGLFKVPPYMRATQSGLIEDAQIIAERISAKRLKDSEASRFWFKRGLSFIRAHPLNYLKLLGKKLVLFLSGREYIDEVVYFIYNEGANLFKLPLFRFSFIFPLAILGMVLSRPASRKIMLLYFFVFSLSLATVLFFINSRYRIIVVPYLIVFSAFGLWRAFKLCRNKQYKNFIFSLSFFFLLYFLTNIKVTAVTSADNFTYHYNKGVIFSDQKQYQKAEEELLTALKINPRDFMSYLGLGNVYYELKDFAKAIDNYKIALIINPYFYKAYFNLGIIYDELGKVEEAEEEFKNVLKLKPDDGAAHYNLGRIYQAKGLVDAALKEYQEALKVKPDHPEILQAIEEIASSLCSSQ